MAENSQEGNQAKTTVAAVEEKKEEKKPSPREKFISRFRERYADIDPDNEDAFYSTLDSDYDGYDSMRSNTEKMTKMMNENEMGAGLIMAIRDGVNPLLWLVENYGDDLTTALKDPENKEDLNKAMAKYADRIAEKTKSKEALDKNLSKFFDHMQKKRDELGLSDDEVMDAIEDIFKIADSGYTGDFPTDIVDTYMKGLRYEKDVEDAANTGEIRGRNQKIQENKAKSTPKKGIPPSVAGGGGAVSAPKPAAKQTNPWMPGYEG